MNWKTIFAAGVLILYTGTLFAQTVTQLQELAPSNITDPNQVFGEAVDIYGSTMVVGGAAMELSGVPGKAYVFEQQNGSWVETQVLLPDDIAESEYDKFGYTASVHGKFIALGAIEILEREEPFPWDPPDWPAQILSSRGVVFVFELIEGIWTQVEKLAIDHLIHQSGSDAKTKSWHVILIISLYSFLGSTIVTAGIGSIKAILQETRMY